jgi:hypothetical protein
MLKKYLPSLLIDLFFVLLLLYSLVTYYNTFLNLLCYPVFLLLLAYMSAGIVVYIRRRKQNPATRLEWVRVLLLTVILIGSVLFFSDIALLPEVIHFNRHRADFTALTTLADDGACFNSSADCRESVTLPPELQASLGWNTMYTETRGAAHYALLFSRPSHDGSTLSSTVYLYIARRTVDPTQRISSSYAALNCPQVLDDGWYACVTSS